METLAISAESPNSPGDPRDRAVVTVDYRRYHRITGLERNEIVRRHVGAKQAKKSHYSGIRAGGRETRGRKEEGRERDSRRHRSTRETSLKVSSNRRPSSALPPSSNNGVALRGEKEEEKWNGRGEGIRRRLIVH